MQPVFAWFALMRSARVRAVAARLNTVVALRACGAVLALALVAGTVVARPVAGPAPNPYLAQSYNNQTHWNDAATDSVATAVPRGFFELTPQAVQVVANESVGLPSFSDRVQGREVHWWWAGFSLRKLTMDDGRLVELARVDLPVKLPQYTPITPDQRRAQAQQVKRLLAAGDEAGLFAYLREQPNRVLSSSADQIVNGAVYALLTRNDGFIGCSGRQIFRIDQADPQLASSAMAMTRSAVLPAALFDNDKAKRGTRLPADMLFGMGMTYNGFLVVNTLGGKVITLHRDTLEVIDNFTVRGDDELFLNSFATGPEADGGAVYVASNTTMYRLVVDAQGRIHDDEASGAWRAAYDRGPRMPAPKIADGTGATPTLMGFGPKDDKLVVITDGARKMRMVAFWRDAVPRGWKQRPGTGSPRIADQREVDLGPGIDIVQSEQSVAVYGDHAFVVNNIAPERAPPPSLDAYYVNLINGATRPGPAGAAAFQWDRRRHAWTQKWARNDVSSISIVPMISGEGRMAIIDGYFTRRWNDRYHIGMDLDSGKTVLSIRTGTDPTFNGMYAPIKVDGQGNLFYGMAFGLVHLDTRKMTRVGIDTLP